MRFSARLFLTIFFSFFLTVAVMLPTAQPTHAQTNQFTMPETNPDVPRNLHTFTQSITLEIMSSFICQLAGVDPLTADHRCLGMDPQTGKLGYVDMQGGAIGTVGTMITALYTPPISTKDYVTYMASNFGVAKSAYAQTTGFDGIKPLARIWQTFLNLVYLFFVIAFAIIGLAIMLRVKIDPRTVMSIENQIPNIIISLVLVTFSFPIAGLLIDVMYISTYLVANTMASADPQIQVKRVNSQFYTPPLGFVNEFYARPGKVNDALEATTGIRGGGGVLDVSGDASLGLQSIVQSLLTPADFKTVFKLDTDNDPDKVAKDCDPSSSWFGYLYSIPCAGITFVSQLSPGQVFSYLLGSLISWTVSVFAFLILIIAMLVALIRLWLILLKAYVFILVDIVTAPFWVIAGLIPGSTVNFESWLRDMIANLAAFPVTIALFLLGKIFIDTFSAPCIGECTNLFVPPLIGNPNAKNALGALIGLGVVLIAPKSLEMTREILKAPTFKYTAAIGESVGPAQSAVGEVAGGVWKRWWKTDTHGSAIGTLATAAQNASGTWGRILRFASGVRDPHRPH